jgi:hypothetical protein
MILGLFKQNSGKLFLCSFLSDDTGEIYYSTEKYILRKYINSEIILKHVYIESEDFLVTRKSRSNTKVYIKSDFSEMLKCGDNYYSDFPKSMKGNDFEKFFRAD